MTPEKTHGPVSFVEYQRMLGLLLVLLRRSKGLVVLSAEEVRTLDVVEPVRLQSAPSANGGRFVTIGEFPYDLRVLLADRIREGV